MPRICVPYATGRAEELPLRMPARITPRLTTLKGCASFATLFTIIRRGMRLVRDPNLCLWSQKSSERNDLLRPHHLLYMFLIMGSYHCIQTGLTPVC